MDDALLQNAIRSLRETLAHLEELRAMRPLSIGEAHARGAYPFDCDLVSVPDVAKRFGVAKEVAVDFLRSNGAVRLPRTTQGGGVPALTLWAIRNEPHWRALSARKRVEAYLARQSLAFDPLEL